MALNIVKKPTSPTSGHPARSFRASQRRDHLRRPFHPARRDIPLDNFLVFCDIPTPVFARDILYPVIVASGDLPPFHSALAKSLLILTRISGTCLFFSLLSLMFGSDPSVRVIVHSGLLPTAL